MILNGRKIVHLRDWMPLPSNLGDSVISRNSTHPKSFIELLQ